MKANATIGMEAMAIALVVLLNTQAADAAPAWKCGKKHCFWTEGYTGPVPDFAKNWRRTPTSSDSS